MRKDYVFVFNFNPKQSFTDYGFLVSPGTYEVVLNTDNPAYGGNGLTDDTVKHFTIADPLYEKEKKEWLKLYIPARTAVVLLMQMEFDKPVILPKTDFPISHNEIFLSTIYGQDTPSPKRIIKKRFAGCRCHKTLFATGIRISELCALVSVTLICTMDQF